MNTEQKAFLSGVSSSNMAAALASLAILTFGPFLGLATQDFPLLMPKAHPSQEEAYICTPVRITDTETFYVTGFKPNATAHTAHHMLVNQTNQKLIFNL